MKSHPAAELFEVLTGKEYDAFKADIKTNGLLEPIHVCDGKILDGRNRYRACKELRIKPATVQFDGDDPVAFVISMNLHRRHLSVGQRTMVAVDIEKVEAARAKERHERLAGRNKGNGGKNATVSDTGKARDKAAAAVDVSPRYVSYGKKLDVDHPDLADKVRRNKLNIPEATELRREREAGQLKGAASKTKEARVAGIRNMAKSGYTSEQIAEKVGVQAIHVRRLAKKNNIQLADAQIGRVHKINARRVIETTVEGLAGYAIGLQTINGQLKEFSADEAGEWADSISNSLKPINKLRRQLSEIANGKD